MTRAETDTVRANTGMDPFASGLGHHRLTPRERLELLTEPGSLRTFRSGVVSRRMGDKAQPGDAVVAGTGTVGGRSIVCYAQDASVVGGSLGLAHAETIVRALRMAGESALPVVAFLESAGARMQEGPAALGGYARIFRENVALSGKVPQISVMTGFAAGGSAYSPALTDFVIMTGGATMFLTGAAIVKETVGETVSSAELGGPRVHERNGVAHFSVRTDVDAVFLARELLGYLPEGKTGTPARVRPEQAPRGDLSNIVPASPREAYDVRDVIAGIVDCGHMLEVAPKWARNIVTGFVRIDGWSVGVVANQPKHLSGCLDIAAAQKAARFVRTCNAFGVPLLVLVDTPGFMPGTKQEGGGVIRHGAKLLYAFAEATVPRITVILRKAYGGAFISMNAKDLGADLAFAWPKAEVGIMGGSQAVSILNRRELEDADDSGATLERLTEEYSDEYGGVQRAIEDGIVDEIIEPGQTRDRVAAGLSLLNERLRGRPNRGNMPL